MSDIRVFAAEAVSSGFSEWAVFSPSCFVASGHGRIYQINNIWLVNVL